MILRLGTFSLLFVLSTRLETTGAFAREGEAPVPATAPVVAIGDIHGDFPAFRQLLRAARLIDDDDRWSGGTTRLVQTGDVVDRGPESRRALELLMRLETEARASGGSVTVLLGNHEAMNLVGDVAFVHDGEFAAFAAEEDPRHRSRRRDEILSLVDRGSPLLRSQFYNELRAELRKETFDRAYPSGFFAHRLAFSPEGRIGKWLLARPVLHREGETLFVHGGLSRRFAAWSAEEVNLAVQESLSEWFDVVRGLEVLGVFDRDLGVERLFRLVQLEEAAGNLHPDLRSLFTRLRKLRSGLFLAEDGPLWYRGLATEPEHRLAHDVAATLRLQGVRRIVVGHTQPASGTIESRLGGRVLLIDTGMNQEAYGGCPSALFIDPNGRLRALEVPGVLRLSPAPRPRSAATTR
jgi:hypothetical protein